MSRASFRQSTNIFTYYNRNPRKIKTSADCVPRAISGALGITWEDVVRGLTEKGLELKGVLNEKKVYNAWLEEHGWHKQKMPRKPNNKRYMVKEFLQENPKGTFIISVANHLTFIEDGILYDTWNCSHKSVGNYWVATNQYVEPNNSSKVKRKPTRKVLL